MEEINYLMTISSLQTYWHQRIDNVNRLPHHQPTRELCRSRSQTLGRPSFTLPLNMLC